MSQDTARELAALRRMTARQLADRYAELFGETPRTKNRAWLLKRVAWRTQAIAEGDLSERARRRAAELANDADLRLNPPRDRAAEPAPERTVVRPAPVQTDDRLPPPGTVLTRSYKGQNLQVKVLADGFEFDGEVYPSLSAVAKAITGSHCNGFLFFKLTRKETA